MMIERGVVIHETFIFMYFKRLKRWIPSVVFGTIEFCQWPGKEVVQFFDCGVVSSYEITFPWESQTRKRPGTSNNFSS